MKGNLMQEKERKSRKKRFPFRTVLMTVAVTAVSVGIIAYLVAYNAVKKQYEYSRQPIVIEESEAMKTLKDNLASGTGVTMALRQSFKNYLIIYSGNSYSFYPVNYDMKMHNRKKENLRVLPSGEWQYIEKGRKVSRKGIDVSSHQGEISWADVKEDGVEFAIIRAVYRGYESGKLVVDTCFNDNAKGANEQGIETGAYLFSQAINEAELDEEIELLLETIRPYDIKGPVVMDIEPADGGAGRADSLSASERTALAKHFTEKIKAAGYRPMLYYNYETALLLLNTDELEESDKWYASYTSDFYYPYYYSYWQYTSSGKVKGINGDVDMDICFE